MTKRILKSGSVFVLLMLLAGTALAADPLFSPRPDWETGITTDANQIVFGDYDGDGDLDLLMASGKPVNGVALFENKDGKLSKTVSRKIGADERVWEILNDASPGPIAELRKQWNDLPAPETASGAEKARPGCRRLRDWLLVRRTSFIPQPGNFRINNMHPRSQPIILWMNREIAERRRLGKLPPDDGKPETKELWEAIKIFCDVFPDAFYVSERGRMLLPPDQPTRAGCWVPVFT